MPNRTVERREGDGPLEPSIFASFARWIKQQLGRSTAFVLVILSPSLRIRGTGPEAVLEAGHVLAAFPHRQPAVSPGDSSS
jgi:hypothetical protein